VIAYTDLKPQHEALRAELHQAMGEVLDSRQFILGSFVARFEEEFARYCGVGHAIAVNSGTSALHLALLAAGVGPGDEVITVPFTFAATAAAIHYCGARPIFVDVERGTCLMDPSRLATALTPKTKAVLPVHLYGQPAEMEPIVGFARVHGLKVIEDAAQAHGAEYRGVRCGALGDLGCFSFYPTKNLGACGEGGMVTTQDAELARRVRLLRDWGQETKYRHTMRGFNYRMEGFQGAILSVKLRHLEAWTERRREIARLYDRALEGAPVVRPVARPEVRHVYHTYTVRTAEREQLQRRLSEAGIGWAIHYPIPLHLQPAYGDPAWPAGSLPEAEAAAAEVLSLPIYPDLSDEQAATVAAAVRG
jgi:dTDP-4-amino-4,6-dideoxygalactose transaminase